MGGKMRTGAPNIIIGMVDVRDVARAHIVAMKHPNAKVGLVKSSKLIPNPNFHLS